MSMVIEVVADVVEKVDLASLEIMKGYILLMKITRS